MTPLSELRSNPHDMRIGGVHVTLTRGRSGKVRVECACRPFAEQKWCTHAVEALCLRAGDDDAQDIVLDTKAEELGNAVDLELGTLQDRYAELRTLVEQHGAAPDVGPDLVALSKAADYFRQAVDAVTSSVRDLRRAIA